MQQDRWLFNLAIFNDERVIKIVFNFHCFHLFPLIHQETFNKLFRGPLIYSLKIAILCYSPDFLTESGFGHQKWCWNQRKTFIDTKRKTRKFEAYFKNSNRFFWTFFWVYFEMSDYLKFPPIFHAAAYRKGLGEIDLEKLTVLKLEC